MKPVVSTYEIFNVNCIDCYKMMLTQNKNLKKIAEYLNFCHCLMLQCKNPYLQERYCSTWLLVLGVIWTTSKAVTQQQWELWMLMWAMGNSWWNFPMKPGHSSQVWPKPIISEIYIYIKNCSRLNKDLSIYSFVRMNTLSWRNIPNRILIWKI